MATVIYTVLVNKVNIGVETLGKMIERVEGYNPDVADKTRFEGPNDGRFRLKRRR